MSVVTNLQSVGAFQMPLIKPYNEAAMTRVVAPFVEGVPSARLPPVTPPGSSGALIIAHADTPPAEIAAKRDGIDLDHIPISNDADVLIDDIPTLALPEAPKIVTEPPETPKFGPLDQPLAYTTPDDLSEAAERIYAEARDVIGPKSEKIPPPQQSALHAPDPAPAVKQDLIIPPP